MSLISFNYPIVTYNNQNNIQERFTIFNDLLSAGKYKIVYQILKMANHPINPSSIAGIREIYNQEEVLPLAQHFLTAEPYSTSGRAFENAKMNIGSDNISYLKIASTSLRQLLIMSPKKCVKKNIERWGFYNLHIDRIRNIIQGIYAHSFNVLFDSLLNKKIITQYEYDYYTVQEAREWFIMPGNSDRITDLVLQGEGINLNVMPHEITYLTKLNRLDIVNTNIKDFSTILNFRNLVKLNLSSNSLESRDIMQFAGQPSLKELTLSGNQITSIEFLPCFKQLTHLDLSGNKLESLDLLLRMEYLVGLTLSNCGIKGSQEANILGNLTRLEELDISDNDITNVDFVVNMIALRELNISLNKRIESIRSLLDSEKLEFLQFLNVLGLDSLRESIQEIENGLRFNGLGFKYIGFGEYESQESQPQESQSQ